MEVFFLEVRTARWKSRPDVQHRSGGVTEVRSISQSPELQVLRLRRDEKRPNFALDDKVDYCAKFSYAVAETGARRRARVRLLRVHKW